MYAPEKHVQLKPGQVESEQAYQWEHKLRYHGPGHFAQMQAQEACVEVRAVQHSQPHVQEEEAEVAVVAVTHAISDEHAVVFTLEDAHPAYRAMPCTRRLNCFARGTELPLLADRGGKDDVAGGGVRQPQAHVVAHDVDQQECSDHCVSVKGSRRARVEFWQDEASLVHKRGRDHERHEYEGADVGHLAREYVLAPARERHRGELWKMKWKQKD